MARKSTSAVKTVNSHLSKIDVVKFDDTNSFGTWRCEVMDVLTTSNLEDALLLKKKTEETSTKDWDKMNKMGCGIIRFCLIQDIKYHVMTKASAKKIWEILESKYLTKNINNRLYLKRRLY